VVVGMEVIRPGGNILTVTARGFGKRTAPEKYRQQHRGGQGVIGLKVTDRNGPVMGILQVSEDDEIMLVSDRGKIVRIAVKGISVIGRVTQGVKLMDTEAGERVVSLAKVAEKGENGDDGEASLGFE
jgi:DNA gyrase subunit A